MTITVKDSAKSKNWTAALRKAKTSTAKEGSAYGVIFKKLANAIVLL